MTRPSVIGLAIGLSASGLSIGGNLRRGDPHLVSLAPDMVSLIAIAVVTSAGVRWAIRQHSPGNGRDAGARVALIAGVVCAVAMAVFTWWYLPTHALSLAAFAAVGSFVLVVIVGLMSANAGHRRNQEVGHG